MRTAGMPGAGRVVGGVAALAILLVVRLAVGGGPVGLALDIALAVVAAVAALDASRLASAGRSRRAWRFQVAAPVAWAAGTLGGLLGLPGPVPAVGRAALVALAATAWWLTSHYADPWSRVRLAVDAGMAQASLLVVGWSLVLSSVWDQQDGGWARVLAIGLPLGAAGIAVFASGLALTEMRPGRRLMPALYVAGFLVLAVSDVLHALGMTPVWAVGFGLFALATRTYGGTSRRLQVMSTRRALVWFPYLLIAPAAATLLVHHVQGGVPLVETAASVAVVVMLLARQHVTLSENRRLVERLAASERRLRHLATHDSLTGLAGRVLLYERLDEVLGGSRSSRPPVAVVFLDLDDFKEVNDSLGHAAGDHVLVETARRLRHLLAPLGAAVTTARMSGDEFAVLLTGDAVATAEEIALRMVDVVQEPMALNGVTVSVGGSIGVAVADGDVDPSALLRAADVAMYDVKHHGKSGVRVAPTVRA